MAQSITAHSYIIIADTIIRVNVESGISESVIAESLDRGINPSSGCVRLNTVITDGCTVFQIICSIDAEHFRLSPSVPWRSASGSLDMRSGDDQKGGGECRSEIG